MTDETLLLRQINPSWVQQDHVTSQAFRPTPKDECKLSVYDGDMITPERSWNHYTSQLGYKSMGVMAVSVIECKGQELRVRPDPRPFPEHAVIDFTGLGTNQIEKKSKRLRVAAELRGWRFRVGAGE
ncbi:MAG: hypothetical protein KAY37_15835 [Phycisphaerae bacterium]|nr:hypothetical protein [Phycisphaerae bacterium]